MASKAPSNEFLSLLARLVSNVEMSSGQFCRPPNPTMTATLVPPVCRRGLLGVAIACSSTT